MLGKAVRDEVERILKVLRDRQISNSMASVLVNGTAEPEIIDQANLRRMVVPKGFDIEDVDDSYQVHSPKTSEG
jgi:hypothetical protein